MGRKLGQTELRFETYCEHEYGYAQGELQVLYRGVYFVRKEMFFREDSCHVYAPDGEKKGLIKWTYQVANREHRTPEEIRIEEAKPLVREDLIGLIRIHEATLEGTGSALSNRKYQAEAELRVRLGEESWKLEYGGELAWRGDAKIEYVVMGSQKIELDILHEGRVMLEGTREEM